MAQLREIIKYEYSKCMKDPVYFIKRYCYIQHPMRGKIKFELYPFQERVMNQFRTHDKNIILKSRQLGISTLSAAYSLWFALFFSDKNIIILATKQSVAKNLIIKVREMYDSLPAWLKKQTDEYNKMSVRFTNGSQIKAESTSKESGRSEAASLLIIDEAAFIDHIEDIWASAQQTLATGGKAIILSTPNGVGNFFYDMWTEAEEGLNGFNPIRLHWTVHPERDQEWRDKQDKELGKKLAAQECDCDFLTSGTSVVDQAIIDDIERTTVQEPIEKRGYDHGYWIWKPIDYSKDYLVVADVARGDGTDFSTFHVFDIESVEQVAEYKGKPPTKEFGHMLVSVATEWNDAMLVIENTGVGWAAIQPAVDRNYPNLYYTNKNETATPEQVYVKGLDMKSNVDMIPGFSTTTKTRPLVISKMELYCRERACIIRSKRLTNELKVFIWHPSGKAAAMNRKNDDLVMAFGIAMFIRDTALKLRQQGIELTKHSISNISSNMIFTNNDMQTRLNYNPWEMNIGNQQKMDLTWLIGKKK